ncbi:MAG: DUF348 domain-containing protein, partial [Anaerolineae bacterium]|nr:DUF348 domain-containing protein [Anaerolineae bacterium]
PEGGTIRVQLARRLLVVHDGQVSTFDTQVKDLRQALKDAGVILGQRDQVFLGMAKAPLHDVEISAPVLPGDPSIPILLQALRYPLRVFVRRAVPLQVREEGVNLVFFTTARTVERALREQGIPVYAQDRVYPGLDTRIVPGMQVFIERSRALTLEDGGRSFSLRTRAKTVAELLSERGLVLGEKDYVLPSLLAPIREGMHVAIMRVYEERYVEEIPIPFETRWEPDPEMEIDQHRVANWGHEGARRRQVLVRFENGREISRTVEAEWVVREPADRVIKYGTKIVIRELETPSGPVKYWRKLRMLATSYNAPTAGKPFDHPFYGITRIGWRARKGIIAVDPRVINLRQKMYVPGYGFGVAADTGSAIKWRRIDLCFDDDNLELWYRWVDVYLLLPVPDEKDIRWVIPNWPKEKG